MQLAKNIYCYRIGLIVCYILLFIPGLAAAQTIHSKIAQLLQQQGLAGAVYTIVDSSSITCYAAGLKDLETGERIHHDNKVNVGSIAKTLLAMGVLRLATQDKLHLDDPIKKYLPAIPLSNPWENSQAVTIRHLLDHTSGLSDIRLWHLFNSDSGPQTALHTFYARNPKVLTIHAKPGSLFSYSNMGYTLLGMLVEAVTNESYESYLDQHLLLPIGLKNSTFHFVSQQGDSQLAMGHFDDGAKAPATPIYVRPAGQFTTTAYDMGILLQFILRGGKVNGKEFIRLEYMNGLAAPERTIAFKNGLKMGYALGAVSRDRHKVVGIAHSGNTIGFRAMYMAFPDQKKAFFIAHNMDSETADYETFNQALTEHLKLIPAIQPRAIRTTPLDPSSKWDGYYVPVITRIEPMKLFDIISGHTLVETTPLGVSLKPFQKKSILLQRSDDRLFRAIDKVHASHVFYEDENAQKYLSTGILTLKRIDTWKLYLIISGFIIGLLAYVVLLLLNSYRLFKKGPRLYVYPSFYATTTLWLTLIAGAVVAYNGVMHMGNRNFATILLYGSTILLPFGVFVALFLYTKKMKANISNYEFWLIVLVTPCLILLLYYGLIPFVSWQ